MAVFVAAVVLAAAVALVAVVPPWLRYRRLLNEVEARLEAIDAGPETP